MSNSNFCLGRIVDMKSGEVTKEDFFYDSDDLITNAIITGMIGSGKTGLGVGMLE